MVLEQLSNHFGEKGGKMPPFQLVLKIVFEGKKQLIYNPGLSIIICRVSNER